jgi:deoxyribodipyrimidine photo-lyase
MSTALVWFRRDLRLTDHPALRAALAAADAVQPVFVWAPDEEGGWAPGGASRWWLHRSLAALEGALAARGARLLLRRGPSAAALLDVARAVGATSVHFQRAVEPALAARDAEVVAALAAHGIEAQRHDGALLAPPSALRTGAGDPYRVFTPFWNALQRQRAVPAPSAAPRALPAPRGALRSEPLAALALAPRIPWDAGLAEAWTPGEAGGLARLARFADGALASYHEARDLPGVDGVSRLSPHLHFGELSPRQAWHASLRAPGAGSESFRRELGWREFAHHVLWHFPHTPEAPLQARFAAFPWRRDAEAVLAAWQRGRTGIPLVDAGMRELWRTGWMHNRVRMVAASLLVKNLLVDWRHGARWFWDTLVDADLANNSMGWQWTAGCGADAAPYHRVFNPVLQSRRFDPAGAYLRRWLPELARLPDADLHAPWEAAPVALAAAGVHLGRDYPEPIVDLAASRAAALAALKSMGR